MQVRSLALFSGTGIRCCHELWCRSQMQLGSGVAVAVVQASSCSSDSTPSLGIFICLECSPKKQRKKKRMLIKCEPYLSALNKRSDLEKVGKFLSNNLKPVLCLEQWFSTGCNWEPPLAMSGDIFGCHSLGGTLGIQQVEAKNPAKHPGMHGTDPHFKELSSSKCQQR